MSRVVGIDLGTTNSLVAYVDNGAPVVIRDRSGDALVPSVVSVAEDNTVFVGREAERRLLTDAGRTVYSVKRFMGKGVHDVGEESRLFPFRIAGDPGGIVRIGLGEREFTAPEIGDNVPVPGRKLMRTAAMPFPIVSGSVTMFVSVPVTAPRLAASFTESRCAGRLPLEPFSVATPPTFNNSGAFTSSPTRKSRNMAPRSAKAPRKSLGASQPRTLSSAQ